MKTKSKIIAGLLFFSLATFAQKEEMKTLKKIYAKETISSEDLIEYKKNATKLGDVAIEENDKIYSDFYKSMLPILEVKALGNDATTMQKANFLNLETITNLSSSLNATLEYEKNSGKKIYTDNINETIKNFKPIIWQFVIELDGQKKYKEVSQIAYSLYQLDKKDQERLYIAADYALRAQDYDNSIKLYKELNTLNYTGESTNYLAKNKANDQEDYFNNISERDIAVKIGTHTNPRIEKITSKRGEIYKNLAMAYIAKNDIAGAKKSISDARLANPEDTSLIIAEANLYYKTNDLEMYKKLISEATIKNPNDADLFYNLGVVLSQSKDEASKIEAEKNYIKAITIDPKYKNAYINLTVLKLDGESKLVDQMNKLGTTPADNKKYEVLKAKQQGLYKSALPYLEKAEELFTGDSEIKSTLLNVYNALDMTDKYKALKAKK
ncbi:MAG: hypothetical protein ABI549_08750 [Flavobacterium sp.]|uniref:tetratricopeptide repeat protein n=1 Tax=Flavobacterium sp. TaxID=239 RepID=UPI0032653448